MNRRIPLVGVTVGLVMALVWLLATVTVQASCAHSSEPSAASKLGECAYIPGRDTEKIGCGRGFIPPNYDVHYPIRIQLQVYSQTGEALHVIGSRESVVSLYCQKRQLNFYRRLAAC